MKKMLKFMFNYVLSVDKRIIFLFTLLLMFNTVLITQTPQWLWITQAGGIDYDGGSAIAIDDAGNSYVTGIFRDTATFGSYSLTSSGRGDIFVAKMDDSGNWLWVAQAGGTDLDFGIAIVIDSSGNSYVTGVFEGTATFGSCSIISNGDLDIFVAKMDESGNWQWAIQAGATQHDYGRAIAIDDAGNSYVTGYFDDTAAFGSYSLTSSGDADIFVAKIDTLGNWQWAIQAGGSEWDYGYAIKIDDARNCYVTGSFRSTATFGSYSLTSSGGFDIFVAKLNSSVFAENEISPTINSLSNYPNPFNPETTISYQLRADSKVQLSIYNIRGQLVKTLVNEIKPAGEYFVIWNGKDSNGNRVGSGIYLYKLIAGDFQKVRRMILLR